MSLGLAVMVRAQAPGASGSARGRERATLLVGTASVDSPGELAGESPLPPPAPLDESVLPAQLKDAAPAEKGTSDDEDDPLPGVDALPSALAQANPPPRGQANPPASGAGRFQPGPTPRTTSPTPPAARPPAGAPSRTPARTQQQRNPQPNAQPPADLSQQIQFDPNGLVTMHTNELDVRQLLELLSRRSGMNILVSPKVGGTITANFEGVTVESVLNAIIKLANLVDKQEGSIHYIYTKEELQDEEEFTKKERILTKVYKLNYVRADEILGVIRPFLSHDVGQKRIAVTPSYRFGISESATFVSGGGQQMSAGGGGGGVAAAGGTGGPGGAPPTGGGPTIGGFQPPTGGNSLADFDHLIIQDYESNLKIIDQIIQRVDVRPVQVLIEAVIISVDYEHDRELGVNLGLVDSLGQTLGTIGSGTALNGNVGFTPYRVLTTTGQIAQGTASDAQGFTSATNGVKFGFVSNNVTGFIRALETIGNTKILASPRILVLNKQRAEIQLGERLGFQTLSQNFTSTIQQVQFLNTGTLLRLRPFVSDDGMVRMEIHPERSSGSVTNNIPNQNTAELTTNVMVPDGSTLVIGGLIEDEDDYSYQGLPGLSRWPALGFLTGINQKNEGRRELVVLLTPHIWCGEPAMAHAPAGGPSPGAFDAAGAAPTRAMTFDLQTNQDSASATKGAASDPATRPAGLPAPAAMGGPVPSPGSGRAGPPPGAAVDPSRTAMPAPADPRTAGAAMASTAPPAVAPVPNEPTTPRRRRTFLRDWFSRRSRNDQATPPADLARASTLPPATATGPMPTASPAAGQPIGGPGVLQPGSGAAPGAGPDPGPVAVPTPPPQQLLPLPDVGDAKPGNAPMLAVPVGATAMDDHHPHRDPMLAQVGWNPERGGTRSEARLPGRGLTDPEDSGRPREDDPRAVVAGPRRHTIALGETCETIARRYYGSEQLAGPLREYNRGRIARGGLRPGDMLVIPPREDLPSVGGWVVQAPSRPDPEPENAGGRGVNPRRVRKVESDDRDSARPLAGETEAEAARPASIAGRMTRRPRAIYHVVGPNETPRSIARDRLGDAQRAKEIVDLNYRLLAAEGRWKPGLRILLPPDAR